jgi:hypothetical protein
MTMSTNSETDDLDIVDTTAAADVLDDDQKVDDDGLDDALARLSNEQVAAVARIRAEFGDEAFRRWAVDELQRGDNGRKIANEDTDDCASVPNG